MLDKICQDWYWDLTDSRVGSKFQTGTNGTLSISSNFSGGSKVIYTKYSKHWPYTVAHTIDCVCRKY